MPGDCLAEELTRVGWTEADLGEERKSAPAMLEIAARLSKNGAGSKEIAAFLWLGTPKGAYATFAPLYARYRKRAIKMEKDENPWVDPPI
ncbi:MAG: hypothetical protein JWM99_5189 [Verrucomicrobiales bacterium]|nr:hypothetical protein [Verrucomicrobiales bacterium]